MDLPVERIPTLVAGIGTLLLGVVVVAMSPRSPLHRAFGLFSGLRGGMLALQAFSLPLTDLQGRVLVYLLLALPFAAVWLAHVFLRRQRRSGPLDVRLAAALIAGAMVVEALYLGDHGLFFDRAGPLGVFFILQFVTYAAIGLVVVYMYRGCPPGPRRRALFPLALAFVAQPTYWISFSLIDEWSPPRLDALQVAEAFLAAAVLGILAYIAFRVTRIRDTAEEKHDRWRFLAVQGLAAATGVGGYAYGRWNPAPTYAHVYLNAAWILFLVAAVAYAIVRYELFSIDLRVKSFLRHGSTAVVVGAIFVIVSELLEDRLASEGVASLLAALAIAGGVYPVSRLTRRMADRLMPGIDSGNEYRNARRREIYRAALHQALRDGHVSHEEKAALDALWKSLGIPGREAHQLEKEMRTA